MLLIFVGFRLYVDLYFVELYACCRLLTADPLLNIISQHGDQHWKPERRNKYADHDIKYNAEAPDVVSRAVVRNALQHLRRSIGGTTAVRPTELVCRLDASKTEVRHLDVVVDVQQNVLAFQISARHTPTSNS